MYILHGLPAGILDRLERIYEVLQLYERTGYPGEGKELSGLLGGNGQIAGRTAVAAGVRRM